MVKLLFSHFQITNLKLILREKCSNSELFWSAFSHIRTELREMLRISPHSVRMRENADENNTEYGHFSRSVINEKNP